MMSHTPISPDPPMPRVPPTQGDGKPPLAGRPDLGEIACFQFSFALGCLAAGWVAIALLQPEDVGWNEAREARRQLSLVTQAAFEGWAGRLLAVRSGAGG